jgi:hypothetical protein
MLCTCFTGYSFRSPSEFLKEAKTSSHSFFPITVHMPPEILLDANSTMPNILLEFVVICCLQFVIYNNHCFSTTNYLCRSMEKRPYGEDNGSPAVE